MANGDVTKVVVLGRIALPGGGNTTEGGQVQNKVVVWGEITCTAADAGIDLNADGNAIKSLGVDVLDVIDIRLKTTDGQQASNDKLHLFDLSRSALLIHHLEDVGAADSIPCSSTDVLTLSYWAIGDEFVAENL